jgi:hypothetical protein
MWSIPIKSNNNNNKQLRSVNICNEMIFFFNFPFKFGKRGRTKLFLNRKELLFLQCKVGHHLHSPIEFEPLDLAFCQLIGAPTRPIIKFGQMAYIYIYIYIKRKKKRKEKNEFSSGSKILKKLPRMRTEVHGHLNSIP